MASLSRLKQVTQFLRNAAPEEFDLFVHEYNDYTAEVVQAVTDAPQNEILVMQGRAQQCRAIHRLFDEVKK